MGVGYIPGLQPEVHRASSAQTEPLGQSGQHRVGMGPDRDMGDRDRDPRGHAGMDGERIARNGCPGNGNALESDADLTGSSDLAGNAGGLRRSRLGRSRSRRVSSPSDSCGSLAPEADISCRGRGRRPGGRIRRNLRRGFEFGVHGFTESISGDWLLERRSNSPAVWLDQGVSYGDRQGTRRL